MAKYYQNFVGLNTWIYDPNTWSASDQEKLLSDPARDTLSDAGYSEPHNYEVLRVANDQVFHNLELNHFGANALAAPSYAGISTIKWYENGLFDDAYPLPGNAQWDMSTRFCLLMLHRNGPYGYPMWKQIRVGENPLTRRQRKENIMTIVEEPGDEFEFKRNGKIFKQRARRGKIKLYVNETPVCSKYKPVEVHGGFASSNSDITRLILKSSYGNETEFFNNLELNDKVGRSNISSENYRKLTNMYLNGNLNSDSSPLDIYEVFKYREVVYPPSLYTYKNYTRQRTNFSFNWRDSRDDRTVITTNNGFDSYTTQSMWPMDASRSFITGANSTWMLIGKNGIGRYGYQINRIHNEEADFGILQNQYSFGTDNLNTYIDLGTTINQLRTGPRYALPHTLKITSSMVASPGGMAIQGLVPASISSSFGFSGVDEYDHGTFLTEGTGAVPGGEAWWDTPTQAGKGPFYDSYGNFVQGPRQLGKDCTIIPEFRISNHIKTYASHGILSQSANMFEITGGLKNTSDSSNDNFYKIYSNTDFLKKFDLVVEDHKEISNPLAIKLTCKAIKKFLPYNGFYPQQRTVEIAQQFYSSYSGSVSYQAGDSVFGIQSDTNSFLFQNMLTPIAAPGCLFNSIKAGVACDYPIITGSLLVKHTATTTKDPLTGSNIFDLTNQGDYVLYRTGSLTGVGLRKSIFDKRIPFEALIEPEKHLADTELQCNNPHPDANTSGSVMWSGQGDSHYKLMMHNFLAETSNFFLKNKNYTKIVSSPSNDPKIRNIPNGSKWSMRIKMFKTFLGSNPASASYDVSFIPPQQRGEGMYESFTMYSRPTAFGPPYCPEILLHSAGTTMKVTSKHGLNGQQYAHTPPYYHGQAFADITFEADKDGDFTIPEIIRKSKVKYWRYIDSDYLFSNKTNQAYYRTHAINQDAMQLSSSVNLFSLERDDSGDLNEETTRWVIQTKFETPVLNFNHLGAADAVSLPYYASESVPRGMWHQYGKIETDPEKGIFLQVTDIPNPHVSKVIGGSPPMYNTGSLADLLGFSTDPVRLGQVAEAKDIFEAVVAVPFIEEGGSRKFFSIPRIDIGNAKRKSQLAGNSLIKMVEKMQKYVFPPSMDFLSNITVEPFAMYIFEFKHTLSRQDLADIWQGLYPECTEKMETAESSLSHQLLAHELLGGGAVIKQTSDNQILSINERGTPLPEKIRWMVFKVKQKAETNYYNNIVGRDEKLPQVAVGPQGENVDVSYNWPYDYFSLVELAKMEAEVTLGELEAKPDTVVVKPYVGIRAEVPEQARESVMAPLPSAQEAMASGLITQNFGAPEESSMLLTTAGFSTEPQSEREVMEQNYDPSKPSEYYSCAQLRAFKDAGVSLRIRHNNRLASNWCKSQGF